jgi:hypothetical protein
MKAILSSTLAALLFFPAQAAEKKAELISSHKIWDAAPHNAFTDLIRFGDEWLCTFREGREHVSPDGMIRVIHSADAHSWESWTGLQIAGLDLRDPKICLTPEGKVMLTMAGARRELKPPAHESYSWFTSDGKKMQGPFRIGDDNVWLWRVVWHKGTAYSVGYETTGEKFVRLYHSKDGRKFNVLVPTLFDEGSPNETGLVFRKDDTAFCLLRRDGEPSSGKFGISKPPYTEWQWKDLGVKIGGPQMIELPDGRLIAGVRLYDGKVRTSIVQVNPERGTLTELLALPSNGDSSYPGLVWHEGILFVSYYSSHEGKTAIYLARVKL